MLDDSELILELAEKSLADAGYEVRTASNLASFESQRSRGGFDLVILDINMPEFYGDDIGNILRNVNGIDVPIYLFSTVPDDEMAARVSEAGIDGFVSKNGGMDALVAKVRSVLAG